MAKGVRNERLLLREVRKSLLPALWRKGEVKKLLAENKEAIKELAEKLDDLDGEIIKISLKYDVSLKDITANIAYSYMVKTKDIIGYSDEEIKRAAKDSLRKKDVN